MAEADGRAVFCSAAVFLCSLFRVCEVRFKPCVFNGVANMADVDYLILAQT
ncbi:hypothetical protein [Paraburkholderia sp. BR10954]|uniref:hypothetical protein n=1 Tax=Paraburkholderia sp. BR10954 TaxID=3236995 RepID=UPI0034D32738